ncbi:MAG: YdcF family protein [Protaetiibacter sp.]
MRWLGWAVAAAVVVAVLAWGEEMHRRSSHRLLGSPAPPGPREVVVVLGYRDRGRRANLINRHRLRVGLRSRTDPRGLLVLSGGAVHGPVPEAELLARYARELGYRGELATETASRTTRENIRNVIPLIEDADRIVIASNALHAEKAREYLWALRPDLASRLARADDHRVGELTLLKPVMAVLALRARGIRATAPGAAPSDPTAIDAP